jgi:hypothetical protein
MLLIRKLDMREYGNSKVRFGLFKCSYCNQEVEKPYYNGLKLQSCGSTGNNCSPLTKFDKSLDRARRIHGNMKQRCSNPNHDSYVDYGAKGVTVCDKWNTFEGFWEDMQEGYSDDLTIDRISSKLGYFKENCQWISLEENSAKSKAIKTAQIDKETGKIIKIWFSAREAAFELGIDPSSIIKVCKGKKKSAGGFVWQNHIDNAIS